MSPGLRQRLAAILAIAWREATVLRHDRGFVSMIVAQPIIMLLLYGYGLSNTPANVPWAVLDRSQTAPSRRLVREIERSGYFLPPTTIASYDQGHDLLRRGRALAVLVVPPSFRRDLQDGQPRVQLLLDGSDPLSAARVGGYIAQIAHAFGAGPRTREAPLPDTWTAGPIALRQRFAFNPRLADRDFFLATLVGMLLTNLCFSASSLGIVGERETGSYEQTLALPVSAIEIVLGKLLPLVALSYLLFAGTLLAQGLLFDFWPRGSLVALLLLTLPFVLASLAIGVFVSSLAHTSAQAVFITVFFIMPSFVLSGIMFPYEFMPDAIRPIGGLLPLRWYQIALRRLYVRGGDLADVLLPMAAMLAIFGVLLLAIRWQLRPRLG